MVVRKKTSTRRRSRKRRITPEDLTRFTYLADPQMSPDGSTIVFVHKQVGVKNEYVTNLWTVAADGSDAPRAFTAGGRDAHPRWSPDGTRLAFIGAREKTRPQLYTINATGGEATALTGFPEGSIGTFRWSPDGRHLAVSFREQDPEWTVAAKKAREEHGLSEPPRVLDHWWYRLDGDGYFNAQRYALYVIDAETGAHRRLYAGDTLGFFSFDFSPDGKELVVGTNRDRRACLDGWNDDLVRIDVRSGRLRVITGLPRGPKGAVAWSPDGRFIAYAGREGGDFDYSTENLELWVCDVRTGTTRSLTGRTDYCLMAPPMSDTAEVQFAPVLRWHPDSRRLLTIIGWHGEAHLAAVPRRGGAPTFLTSGARVHTMGGLSADGRRLAMMVGTPTKLDEVHTAELTRDAAAVNPVTNLNGALLRELELARPRSHWIRSADGNRVQVWMLPPIGGRVRGNPAVLEIHGGPHAQYGLGFFHEFQVLAAAGYAVFYANPRGSKGYGRDHCAAIRHRWGSADWVDMQAVIEFMQSRPEVDPRRMGVMGGSYGGYMTNWIIGHTRVFAGAITDRCVSNMVTMAGNSDFVEQPGRYFPGNHWDDTEALRAQSPIQHIGNARTPTLIIHSEGDLRCNIEQAEELYTALTLLKVPTRFVRYPRSTSHGMSRGGPPDLRMHRLDQVLAWWAKCLRK